MKNKTMKSVLSLVLALSLVCGLAATASAADITTPGGSADVPVTLTTSAAVFSVTVPTSLPIDIAADGTVTVATPSITNNGNGPVEVKSVEVNPKNGWIIMEDGTDFQERPVNAKEFTMTFFNTPVDTTGDADVSVFPVIDGNQSKTITYDAQVAVQSKAISGAEIADVVITVGWYTGD